MKKLLSIILVVLMLTTLLASCATPVNTSTETDTNTESNINTSESNIESNEGGNASGNGNEQTETNDVINIQCDCQCNKYSISMGEAILIAQNHLFAMRPPEFSFDLTYTATYFSDDEETWTILVAEYDVNPNDELDQVVKDGGYTYVIEKATGRILEITTGE